MSLSFHSNKECLYLQVYEHYKNLIMERRIPAGSRMPSLRKCSAELKLSRTTIENAYLQLAADGYIVARAQSGYYVTNIAEQNALMGENGAGKSTLMKVLTGIYQKDSGSIVYKGQEVAFHNTREAQDNGVVIVHQELNMVGDLTVAQNIFIGREPKKGIRVDDKKMIEDSKKLFQDLNIDIDPREKMSAP